MTAQTYRTTSVRLYGTIQGPIWMPAVICEKHFDIQIGKGPWQQEWTSLRDLLCDVTSDGDFQSASVTRMVLEVKRTKPSFLPHMLSTRTRYVEYDITSAPVALRDLFAEEVFLDEYDD